MATASMTSFFNVHQDIGMQTDCWVFGYGSILWKPGFAFKSRHCGYVDGFARRFWQGSTTHRGTPQSPGRVATLIPRKGERVWGEAFHLVGTSMIEACLQHLGVRECNLGGYEVLQVNFVAAEQSGDANYGQLKGGNCQAWAFVATPDNEYYLGKASMEELAMQVVTASGSSGPNADYVTLLADYVRAYIPQDADEHLFELDKRVRQLMYGISKEPSRRSFVTATHPTATAAQSSDTNQDRHRQDVATAAAAGGRTMNSTAVVSVRAC